MKWTIHVAAALLLGAATAGEARQTAADPAASASRAVAVDSSARASGGAPAAGAAAGTESAIAEVPFGVGERLEYQVKLGPVGVGEGSMEIVDIANVRGWPTYHIRFHVKGGIPLARVNTRMESWLDVGSLVSRRFEQDQNEVRFKRHRIFEIYPEERRWEIVGTDDEGPLASDLPLDDVSFLYFVRTIPLEVGQTYTYNRYFRESGNPVVLHVLRKETVKVPAGTFETIVVQPIIQTSGLFRDGGRAEVYFTDDERRLLVQMKSSVPVIGSLSLHLTSIEEGQPVTPEDLARSAAE